LYPFSDLEINGINMFTFWVNSKYRYVSRWDIWINVCGYIPYGALWVWRLHPKISGVVAICIATFLGSLLSFSLESLQTWVPIRVPSQLDWYTNTVGVFMGSIIAFIFPPHILSKSYIVISYRKYFYLKSSFAIVLCFLWAMAIIFPQPYWFGLGSWVANINDSSFLSYILQYYHGLWVNIDYIFNIGLLNNLNNNINIDVDEENFAHIIITPLVIIFNVCGMLLAITLTMRRKQVSFCILMIFVLYALKIASWGLYLSILDLTIPREVWIGLLISIIVLILLQFTNVMIKASVAILFLILGLFFSNSLPHNLYHEAILDTWENSPYFHMIGLFKWVGLLLPWLAIIWALYQIIFFKRNLSFILKLQAEQTLKTKHILQSSKYQNNNDNDIKDDNNSNNKDIDNISEPEIVSATKLDEDSLNSENLDERNVDAIDVNIKKH
jgi:VanZ family protein